MRYCEERRRYFSTLFRLTIVKLDYFVARQVTDTVTDGRSKPLPYNAAQGLLRRIQYGVVIAVFFTTLSGKLRDFVLRQRMATVAVLCVRHSSHSAVFSAKESIFPLTQV